MSNLKIYTPAELEALAVEHPSGDGDYRRGYHHGYGQAIDDALIVMRRAGIGNGLREAVALTMNQFFDAALTDWRNGADLNKFPPPPGLGSWMDTPSAKEPAQ